MKVFAELLISGRFAFVAEIFLSLDNGGRWSKRDRLPAVSKHRGVSYTMATAANAGLWDAGRLSRE